MKNPIIVATFLILICGSTFLGKLLIDAGFFLKVTPTKQYCEKISNIHAPEDMAIVDSTLFISSTSSFPENSISTFLPV